MNTQDPISNLITIIRNGYLAKKDFVLVDHSKIKFNIVNILKKECFIDNCFIINSDVTKKQIKIILKYYGNKIPVMRKITRISKPSIRIYSKYTFLYKTYNKFSVSIISTSLGIMTNKDAVNNKCGGEVLCMVE